MIDLKELQWRLAETIEWCTLRINPDDPENSLRSPELDFKVQPYDEKGHYIFKIGDWQKAVDELGSV